MDERPTPHPLLRRLAFATLGSPGVTVDDVARIARARGCSGVELRASWDEPVWPGMPADEAAAVRETLAAGGVSVIAVDSYVQLCAPEDDGEQVADLVGQLTLAAQLGAPGVRVFMADTAGDGEPRALERLAEVAGLATSLGVSVYLETHDSHRQARAVVDFVQRAVRTGCPLAVVWDAAHTWAAGESPAESFAALEPHLAYVQVKDIASPADSAPVMLGAGTYPIAELAHALAGWSGWLSLEWERRWHPDLPPLEDALSALPAWLSGSVTGDGS